MNLDSQQQAAVLTESKKALVLAGAGSGKTRVVVERIAHLIENKKISPYEILALTFTRKAAQELRSRIEERVGNKAHHITIGTIHAVALNLLHRFGDLIGMKSRSITVYGGFEEEYLIKEIAIDLGMFKGKTWKVPKKEIYGMLNAYYSKGEEPKEDHPGYILFKELLSRCHENNSKTYGMLLTAMMELVPKIKQYLKWKYIFLDEAQDTDPLQWWIVEEFPKLLGASLFAVGDIDQSIYRFRGAVPEYLVSQQDQFDIYRLENNYRSVPEIVEASNRLIENNLERIPKTMRATRESDGLKIDIQIKKDCDSSKLAKEIKEILEQHFFLPNRKPNEVVVLSRIHKLLEKLSLELTALDIPHVKIGRKSDLIESEEFRKFHAFLKLLVNPFDNMSYLLVRDLIGVSRETYNKIRLQATQESKSHFQVWAGDVTNLYNPWVNFFLAAPGYNFPGVIKRLLTIRAWPFQLDPTLDFIKAYIEKPESTKWNEDPCDEGPIQNYLEWLATWDVQEEIEDNTDKVQLMTVHS
ncbi:MAG: ATP-dependent helicase, partial [Candidatus Helarchaeota archaeon]|nr:ATP-dependent helicase [Candidatus Helarchaeota archaeon]